MAEMTTDAAALSEAATNFDGNSYFFLFEDSASESRAGMQDTEKGVTGMFACTGEASFDRISSDLKSAIGQVDAQIQELSTIQCDISEAATSFDRISSDLKGAIGQVDSTAGDLAGALSGPAGDAAQGCTGESCNGGAAGFLFGDGGDGAHFDGKLLTARDFIREQASVFDAGFDLI